MSAEYEYTDYWTAVSKPPYLTALTLWPCHSAVGGGLFFSDARVWLNHYRRPDPHPNHPKNLWVYNFGKDISEHTLFDRRLIHNGWETIQEWRGKPAEYSRSATLVPGIRRRQNPHGLQELTMTTTVSDYKDQDRFSVRYADGEELPLEDAEWADWDQQGRLIFARNGKIYALAADAIGQAPPEELIDLNGNQPEPMEAPDWAKVWYAAYKHTDRNNSDCMARRLASLGCPLEVRQPPELRDALRRHAAQIAQWSERGSAGL